MAFLEKIFRAEANPKKVIIKICGIKLTFKRSSSPPSQYDIPPEPEPEPTGLENVTGENNNVIFHPDDIPHLALNISGNNNTVIIGKLRSNTTGQLIINAPMDNSTIIIGADLYIRHFCRIDIGLDEPFFEKVDDININIGARTGIEDMVVCTVNSHTKISVGNDCIISCGVVLFQTDSHPVYDFNTGKILNKVNDLIIGDHCWLGARTTILKNSVVANDCIVGWGAVVSGKFEEKHCAIAGNPAKIIKRGVTWERDGSNGYIQNERELQLVGR